MSEKRFSLFHSIKNPSATCHTAESGSSAQQSKKRDSTNSTISIFQSSNHRIQKSLNFELESSKNNILPIFALLLRARSPENQALTRVFSIRKTQHDPNRFELFFRKTQSLKNCFIITQEKASNPWDEIHQAILSLFFSFRIFSI
jgi:hypothetical protein